MTLIKRNFPVFDSLSDFFDDDWLRWKGSGWMPAVNISETDNSYEIEVAVPGMKKEDFTVDLEGNLLTIKGEVKKEEEEIKKNYTRKEYNFKAFSRSFTLPENVAMENIEAKYIDGMLKLVLKKTEVDVPPKKIVKIH
jgi:HSP20 family protein